MLEIRDLKAAMQGDWYVGVGSKARRCHELAFHHIKGTEDWLFIYSDENIFKQECVHAAIFSGDMLLPISADNMAYLEQAKFMDIEGSRHKGIMLAEPIQEPIRMRYAVREMIFTMLRYVRHYSETRIERRILTHHMSAFSYFVVCLVAFALWMYVVGEPFLLKIFQLDSPSYDCRTPIIRFTLLTYSLMIINDFISRNERNIVSAIAIGSLPISVWSFFLVGQDYPWSISIILVSIIAFAVIVFRRNIRRQYGFSYSIERARNAFAWMALIVFLVMFILDRSQQSFHIG